METLTFQNYIEKNEKTFFQYIVQIFSLYTNQDIMIDRLKYFFKYKICNSKGSLFKKYLGNSANYIY